MAKEEKLWRFTAGRRGISLVTVYERYEGSRIYVEWWTRSGHKLQRHQRSLRTPMGEPVLDKKLAQAIAVQMSEDAEAEHKQRGYRSVYGPQHTEAGTKFLTLGDLLQRLHDDKEDGWSAAYTRDQQRYRTFWLEALGEDIRIHDVTPAMVEQVVKDEVARRKASKNGARQWSLRQQQAVLRYIVDAYSYGQHSLKWLTEANNLSAVKVPKPTARHAPAFTVEEMRVLLPALERIDARAGWLGRVLWQGGRRLSATRMMLKENVEVFSDYCVLRYPLDSATKQGGEVVITGEAYRLTLQLMQGSGRYVLGTVPPRMDEAQRWMQQALQEAGIPKRRWLSWHSIKRRYSDRTEGMKGRAAQAATSESTLRRVYDPKDDRTAKLAVARALEEELKDGDA